MKDALFRRILLTHVLTRTLLFGKMSLSPSNSCKTSPQSIGSLMKNLYVVINIVFGNKLRSLGKTPSVLLTLTNILLRWSSKIWNLIWHPSILRRVWKTLFLLKMKGGEAASLFYDFLSLFDRVRVQTYSPLENPIIKIFQSII